MGELLLLSNSRAPGMGFLEHAFEAMREVLGDRSSVLFVPFASSDPDAYESVMREALGRIGTRVSSLHQASDVSRAVRDAEAVFVGGGNTFRLLRTLIRLGGLDVLRQAVRDGTPYLAASAGSNLACPSIRTTNDMPIVEAAPMSALGLIPFQLNPHYLDPVPGSTHQGETRQQRIEEFLEEKGHGCGYPVTGRCWPGWKRCRAEGAGGCCVGTLTQPKSRSARICRTCCAARPASTSASTDSGQPAPSAARP
jgi:dipeptidase E